MDLVVVLSMYYADTLLDSASSIFYLGLQADCLDIATHAGLFIQELIYE